MKQNIISVLIAKRSFNVLEKIINKAANPENIIFAGTVEINISHQKQSLFRSIILSLIILLSTDVSVAQPWVPVGFAGFSAGSVGNTSLVLDGNDTPYVAFEDYTSGTTVMKFNGSSWVNVGVTGFGGRSSLAIDGSDKPYVVFTDATHSNKATVMKYNGSSWVTVGSAGFSAAEAGGTIPRSMSIAIDGSGTPYVAYEDAAYSHKVTVMKFDGSSWITVGSAGLSVGWASWISLAIDGGGTPYVVFDDDGIGGKASVLKYNGSSWVTVGGAGCSAGSVDYTSIAIDGSGNPYIAYMDYFYNKSTVMKYNGSSWVNVGSTCGLDSAAINSIAIDNSGVPYVAGSGMDSKIRVAKYDGSCWVNIGNPVSSADKTWYISLAVNSTGIPYVTYQDSDHSFKATVMKFINSGAGVSGQTDLNLKIALYPNPTKGAFTVNTPESGTLSVYTLDGRKVTSAEVKAGITDVILPSNMATGVYMCSFNGAESKVATATLVYEQN